MIIRRVGAKLRDGLLPRRISVRAESVSRGGVVPDRERGNAERIRRTDVAATEEESGSGFWNAFASAIGGPSSCVPRHRHGPHLGAGAEHMLFLQQQHRRRFGSIAPSGVCLAGETGGEEEQPVRSPLSRAPGPLSGAVGERPPGASPARTAQAVLTGIRQSPKKLNLVAEMVRGMRVEDALTQMAVSVKRAAKTVFKVVHSAQANAVHNFGLEKDRLVVREAFVGKDRYLKRVQPHGKGRAGKLLHRRSRLTVILNEMSAEQEADLARLRVLRRRGTRMSRPEARLAPHRVLKTQWSRQRAPRAPANAGLVGG